MRAAAAFNAMQRRIAAHLAERIQILAAVSLDLDALVESLVCDWTDAGRAVRLEGQSGGASSRGRRRCGGS